MWMDPNVDGSHINISARDLLPNGFTGLPAKIEKAGEGGEIQRFFGANIKKTFSAIPKLRKR